MRDRAFSAGGRVVVPVAAALAAAALVSAPVAAFDEDAKRAPKLGRIVDDQPHRSGIMYLAPDRASDTPSEPEIRRADRKTPWSAGWIKDCADRHKGFDPVTGTYLSASGQYKFCD